MEPEDRDYHKKRIDEGESNEPDVEAHHHQGKFANEDPAVEPEERERHKSGN